MTLLDAYGLVALAAEEPAADQVVELLRQGDCRISAVNLAEAVYILDNVHSLPVAETRELVGPVLFDHVSVAAPTEEDGWRAAQIRVEHYDMKNCALSLADCFLLAHAVGGGEAVATSDPAIAQVAETLGVEVVSLPDRKGRAP